jgi:urease subunit alpha
VNRLSPEERLARFGPTVGDEVRLGDTDLWIRVGEDRQAPGDEPIWGYAKTMRPHSTQGRPSPSELDAVIAGALVVDPVIGVVKADIGIKDGRIVGVGRAGNPGISDGIELPIGPHTQPIMGYGLIATPGAIDSHVHLISPELLPAALSGGVTTLITAGFEEPPYAMARMLDATAAWPLNVGLQACARAEDDGSLEALLDAGACGFKIHEDFGADRASSTTRCGSPRRTTSAWRSTPTASTSAPSSRTPWRRSTAGPSTRITWRAAAAATCPTSSASSASPTSSARRRRPPCRGASTPPRSRSR